eukprot:scaffold1220_cov259-Pinguiococcus_pyrenoidosus.AAC.50
MERGAVDPRLSEASRSGRRNIHVVRSCISEACVGSISERTASRLSLGEQGAAPRNTIKVHCVLGPPRATGDGQRGRGGERWRGGRGKGHRERAQCNGADEKQRKGTAIRQRQRRRSARDQIGVSGLDARHTTYSTG